MARSGGRPRKPTRLKELEGTSRKDRAPKNEPQPKAGAPRRPQYLDATARRVWDLLVPQLAELGILTMVDGSMMEGYCVSYARAVAAERDVIKHGAVVNTPFGPKKNPNVTIAEKAWEALRKFGNEFGLGAAARGHLSLPDKPKKPATDGTPLVGPGVGGPLRVVPGGKPGA